MAGLTIAFFGSSLVSSCRNSAASYYCGLIRSLHKLGHRVTFFEPDISGRKLQRDLPDPGWAKVVLYPATEEGVFNSLESAQSFNLIIKAGNIGIFDELLEREVLRMKNERSQVVFWDSDAPATLKRIKENPDDPFKTLIPKYDLILTLGGGEPIVKDYLSWGAADCIPIYDALDPETYFPVSTDHRLIADLSFLGNRLPSYEKRINDYFFSAAEKLPEMKFILAGSGWKAKKKQENIQYLGRLSPTGYNTFNCSATAVLNISCGHLAGKGVFPSRRIFEAAGAGGCIISDGWDGIDTFFEPGKEMFVAASGGEVAEIVKTLTPGAAAVVGTRALARVRAEHTYAHRARQLERIFGVTERKKCKMMLPEIKIPDYQTFAWQSA